MLKQWYEELFENFGQQYDKEPYTQGTAGECDFIERELNRDQTLEILDVGCGTGRHTIELSRRGYRVTSIDLSDSQLRRAREKAELAGLRISFQRQDARDLPFESQFDAAIMLCEGGFPLMETDELNYAILASVARSLRSPAKFIFTTLNGLYPIHHSTNEAHEPDAGEETSQYAAAGFDLMTFRSHSVATFVDDDGTKRTLQCNERYYVPSEITWLLKSLGFRTIEIFGAKLGAFSRQDALTPDDIEMLVVAEK